MIEPSNMSSISGQFIHWDAVFGQLTLMILPVSVVAAWLKKTVESSLSFSPVSSLMFVIFLFCPQHDPPSSKLLFETKELQHVEWKGFFGCYSWTNGGNSTQTYYIRLIFTDGQNCFAYRTVKQLNSLLHAICFKTCRKFQHF